MAWADLDHELAHLLVDSLLFQPFTLPRDVRVNVCSGDFDKLAHLPDAIGRRSIHFFPLPCEKL